MKNSTLRTACERKSDAGSDDFNGLDVYPGPIKIKCINSVFRRLILLFIFELN